MAVEENAFDRMSQMIENGSFDPFGDVYVAATTESIASSRAGELGFRKKVAAGIVGAIAFATFGLATGNNGDNEKAAALTPQEEAMQEAGFLPSDGNISESYDDPNTEEIETIKDNAIVFFAEQAPEGSNYWGPEGESTSPADALTNMLARDIVDPTSLVGHREEAGLSKRMTVQERDEQVGNYIDDREAFAADQKEFAEYLSDPANKISLSSFTGDYYTMYMKTRTAEGLAPTIHQSKESMQGKLVLRVDIPGEEDSKGVASKEAQTLYYKIDCGYQPVSPVPFENVPELPPEEQQPPHETTSTVPEETTTTSEVTTTTEPEEETTTSTVPEETTTSTVPETTTSTTTVPEETTTTTTPKTTTTTVPPKEDDGKLPGNPDVPADQDPGTPDVPGDGPAEQQPNPDGYLPGETPVTVPETPPTTVPTTTMPEVPATTSPQPVVTEPPKPATTVVATTVPQSGSLPEKP